MATTTIMSSSPPEKMKSPPEETTTTTDTTAEAKMETTTTTNTTEAAVKEEQEEREPTTSPPEHVMIRDPLPNDVLKGRGGGINKHQGNVQFRSFVTERREIYALSSSKQEKVRVAQEVIDLVKQQDPPGRFLKMDPSLTFWVELTDDDMLAKVTQALREGAPEVRRKEQEVLEVLQPSDGSSKPLSKLAVGKIREELRKHKASSASKVPRSKPKPPSGPKPQSSSGKKHKRAHSAMSALAASAIAHQQDGTRLSDTEQQRSFKRSKPLPSGLSAAAKQPPTWSVVPGSPTQDDDPMSTDGEEEYARKRSPNKKKVSPKKRAATTGEAHSPTSLLMQRLDELEERTGELESQLLDEKKQRLKQEQRQGQLEMQLVEVKKARMKQDKVIRKLRRELAELQNKGNDQPEQEEDVVGEGEDDNDHDDDDDDGELSRASSTELLI